VTSLPGESGNPLAADLDGVVGTAAQAWSDLRDARLFVTGGTGFVGTWLLESFAWANRSLSLDAHAVVLTRDPDRFAVRAPHLVADPAISLLRGDVVEFDPPAGPFTHVIHAAAEFGPERETTAPLEVIDTVVRGTRNVLDASRAWGARRVLFTSSGAVYGAQPGDLELLPEEFPGGPDQMAPGSVYGESKRLAELLCATFASRYGLPVTVARLFAFVGPRIPLDAHFAIANFIRDGLSGGPIVVNGDGSPVRSYLYAADLASWLWTILVLGEPGRAYNVGSEAGRNLAEVARVVADAFDPAPEVTVVGAASAVGGGGGNRYVPSTRRASAELGLRETVDLREAVLRTVAWHQTGAS
jgi:nucleoside-diphosphate-sugar epimerase